MLVGVPFFALATLALLWSYQKQCMRHRILVEKTKEGKKWQIVDPDETLGAKVDEAKHFVWTRSEWAVGHGVMFLVVVILSSMMLFAHC